MSPGYAISPEPELNIISEISTGILNAGSGLSAARLGSYQVQYITIAFRLGNTCFGS